MLWAASGCVASWAFVGLHGTANPVVACLLHGVDDHPLLGGIA